MTNKLQYKLMMCICTIILSVMCVSCTDKNSDGGQDKMLSCSTAGFKKDCTNMIQTQGWDISGARFVVNGRLLVCYVSGERNQAMLKLYDTDSWKPVSETVIDIEGYPDFKFFDLAGNNIALTDVSSQRYYFYDENLKLIMTASSQFDDIKNSVPAKDGSGIYYVSEDGKAINFWNVADNTVCNITEASELRDSLHMEEISDDGNTIILTYYNTQSGTLGCGFVNINGDARYVDNMMSNIKEAGGSYYFSHYKANGYINIYDASKPRIVSEFTFDDINEKDCFEIFPDYGLIITWDGKSTLRSYDLNSGVKQGSLEMDTPEGRDNIYVSGKIPITMSGTDSIACIPVYDGSGYRIYLWDCSSNFVADEASGSGIFAELPISEKPDVEELAKTISDKYSIGLFLGNDAVRVFPEFAVIPVSDDDMLGKGLKVLSESLSKYPDGFFSQFSYGSINGFNIYVCSGLIRMEAGNESYPSAVALVYDNAQSIVIDIEETEYIESNLAHEIMHAIDSKIDYMMRYEAFTGFDHDVWNEMNPAGFTYTYGYSNSSGNEYTAESLTAYTPDDPASSNNVNNIYFTDYYACTYPNEDRARIFEYLMTSKDELPWFFDSVSLRRKAEYMCSAIGQAFPGISLEGVYWERLVK